MTTEYLGKLEPSDGPRDVYVWRIDGKTVVAYEHGPAVKCVECGETYVKRPGGDILMNWCYSCREKPPKPDPYVKHGSLFVPNPESREPTPGERPHRAHDDQHRNQCHDDPNDFHDDGGQHDAKLAKHP